MLVKECSINQSRFQLPWKTIYDRVNRTIMHRSEVAHDCNMMSSNFESRTSFDTQMDGLTEDIDHFDDEKTNLQTKLRSYKSQIRRFDC